MFQINTNFKPIKKEVKARKSEVNGRDNIVNTDKFKVDKNFHKSRPTTRQNSEISLEKIVSEDLIRIETDKNSSLNEENDCYTVVRGTGNLLSKDTVKDTPSQNALNRKDNRLKVTDALKGNGRSKNSKSNRLNTLNEQMKYGFNRRKRTASDRQNQFSGLPP